MDIKEIFRGISHKSVSAEPEERAEPSNLDAAYQSILDAQPTNELAALKQAAEVATARVTEAEQQETDRAILKAEKQLQELKDKAAQSETAKAARDKATRDAADAVLKALQDEYWPQVRTLEKESYQLRIALSDNRMKLFHLGHEMARKGLDFEHPVSLIPDENFGGCGNGVAIITRLSGILQTARDAGYSDIPEVFNDARSLAGKLLPSPTPNFYGGGNGSDVATAAVSAGTRQGMISGLGLGIALSEFRHASGEMLQRLRSR